MKYLVIIALLCIFSRNIYSQAVGINTINPASLFHVDTQGNTVGGNNVTDDVVINTLGNLAIGTQVAPNNAKLTLAAGSSLIIRDGSEVEGRALTSDADGFASWGNVVGANGIFLARVRIGLSSGVFSLTLGLNNILPNSQYTAPVDGLYFFELKTWFDYPATTETSSTTHHIRLENVATGIMLDEYEHYQTIAIAAASEQAVGFFTSLSAELKAGDTVQLTDRPTTVIGGDGTGTVAGAPFILPYRAVAPFEYVVKQYNVR